MLAFAAPETVRDALAYLESRFGIAPARLETFAFLESGSAVWILGASPHVAELAALRLEAAGVALLRRKKRGWKPTTAGLRIVGRWATRNVVDLDEAGAARFLSRETIPGRYETDGGFVVVRSGEEVLGCGLVSARGLESQVPAALARGPAQEP